MRERIKANYVKTLKIAVGSAVSIIIANLLQLPFGTAAGIITLLSVQNTKKETLFVAGRRILAFILAMVSAYLIFRILGYSAGSFGVFLFLFVILCEMLGLQDGISICAVLVTHFLTLQQMNLHAVWNEFLLLVIGITVGAATNVYIPRNVKEIRQSQAYIEEKLKEILKELSIQISEPEKQGEILRIQELHLYIQRAVQMAYENRNNTFLSDSKYFISYMELRLTQLTVLERIYLLEQRLDGQTPQAVAISGFMNSIALSLRETNNGVKLLEESEKLLTYFENDDLPTNRKEFENRAVLYQILCELQWFVQLKKDFAENLTRKQIEEFWN